MSDDLKCVTIVRDYNDIESIFCHLLRTNTANVNHGGSDWYDWVIDQVAVDIFGEWFEKRGLTQHIDWWVETWSSDSTYNSDVMALKMYFQFSFIDSREAVLFKLVHK